MRVVSLSAQALAMASEPLPVAVPLVLPKKRGREDSHGDCGQWPSSLSPKQDSQLWPPESRSPQSVWVIVVPGKNKLSDLCENENMSCRLRAASEAQCWALWALVVSAVTTVWRQLLYLVPGVFHTRHGYWFCHVFFIPSLLHSHAIS